MITSRQALEALWSLTGLPADATGSALLTGAEPVLPSSFRVDTAAQVSIAASALAAAELHRLRGGAGQQVSVDLRAAAAIFRGERYMSVDGQPVNDPSDRIFGLFQCGDGRFVRLHTNFPHHRDGVLKVLGGVAHDRAAVAKALEGWKAEAFEQACADAGMAVSMTRSLAEWDAHPQGVAVARHPALIIERIGDAPVQPLPAGGSRPLSGVRVLELTRVVAGPVAGRALASHGADVLLITGGHLPSIPQLVIETGRGKLSAQIDLRDVAGRESLRGLVAGADVFLQGYRPGAIAGQGFAPEELAKLRPGIVCVSLSAYGHEGPWRGRRGFDSLVQNANGMNHAEAEAGGEARPRPLPCQANDHASGYLLALGAMVALHRRATEGGSWHVRVSLAATAQWIRSLGRLPEGLKAPEMTRGDIGDLLEDGDSGFGRLMLVRDAAVMSGTPTGWVRPSVPLGSHAAVWPAG